MEIVAQTEAPVIRSHPIRRFLCAICAFLIALSFTPSIALASDIPTFTFTGTGYGHGIGMSQYGSQGFAMAGWGYDDILAHYYTGTTLGTVSSLTVKVNIDKGYTSSSYTGKPGWTFGGAGTDIIVCNDDYLDPYTVAAGTYVRITNDASEVVLSSESGAELARFSQDVWVRPANASAGFVEVKNMIIGWDGSIPVTTYVGPFSYNNVRFRGEFSMERRADDRLNCINYVDIQDYLYGVVPRETYSYWSPEALKVQAVAARSYGYADIVAGSVLKCTTYSQVYNGHSRLNAEGAVVMHEAVSTNQAVDDTDGQVVTFGGAVCKAYFFSQSGGHTANCEDVWTQALPWACGVPDPYEYLADPSRSPWQEVHQKTYTGLELAEALDNYDEKYGKDYAPPGAGSTVAVVGVSVDRAASNHVLSVVYEFNDAAHTKTSVPKEHNRIALGLSSTVFWINGSPVDRIYGATRYDTAVEASKKAFTGTAPAVVVASGQAYPDALVGSGVAGAVEGSLLLTAKSYLPSVVAAELTRLDPSYVYVMGGEGAVSLDVFNAIEAVVSDDAIVQRIWGEDRYGTSEAAARFILDRASPDRAIVVSGQSWADGAAASAFSYGRVVPVLLTPSSKLHPVIADYLADAAPETTFIIGGEAVVWPVVADTVEDITGETPTRLWGPNRYATATTLVDYLIANEGFDASDVYLATGFAYPDALTGGVLAGLTDSPLLLTRQDSVPGEVRTFLTANRSAMEYTGEIPCPHIC